MFTLLSLKYLKYVLEDNLYHVNFNNKSDGNNITTQFNIQAIYYLYLCVDCGGWTRFEEQAHVLDTEASNNRNQFHSPKILVYIL